MNYVFEVRGNIKNIEEIDKAADKIISILSDNDIEVINLSLSCLDKSLYDVDIICQKKK